MMETKKITTETEGFNKHFKSITLSTLVFTSVSAISFALTQTQGSPTIKGRIY